MTPQDLDERFVDVQSATAFLNRARELISPPAISSRPETGPPLPHPRVEELMPCVRLELARGILNRAHEIISAEVGSLLRSIEPIVRRFDGLPIAANPFVFAGTTTDEQMHTQILAWLLDPTAKHGLSASFLRRFLARLDDPLARQLADAPKLENVSVVSECDLEGARPDVLVVVEGLLVVVECKVQDAEHDIIWGDRPPMSQTECYRQQLGDRGICLQVFERIGLSEFGVTAPTVVSVFVRPAGREPARDLHTTNLTWMDVDEDLAALMTTRNVASDVTFLLRAFRSVLVEYSGSRVPLASSLTHLRSAIDARAGRAVDSLRTYLIAQSVRETLGGGADVGPA